MSARRVINIAVISAMTSFVACSAGMAQIAPYNGGSSYDYCSLRNSDNENVPVGAGPFIGVDQSGTDVDVTWSGDGWNKWHFRWNQNGGADKAYEYGSDQKNFTIHNAGFCQHYTVKIQGCVKHFVGHDRCSGFEQTNFTSGPQRPSGPDTCAQGYVWRGAFPNDRACVSPAVRSQAAADNARHQLAPCPSPLVPRLARPGDTICVSTNVAKGTRDDNGAMCGRFVRCP